MTVTQNPDKDCDRCCTVRLAFVCRLDPALKHGPCANPNLYIMPVLATSLLYFSFSTVVFGRLFLTLRQLSAYHFLHIAKLIANVLYTLM